MIPSAQAHYYVVTYRDPEKLQEGKNLSLKVRRIQDSTLGLTFIELSDFVFDEHSLLVDPAQEHLKKRFENTKSFHLSIYQVISIEEVGSEHPGLTFHKDRSNLYLINKETH